jgi:adenylyltransferase and sulfurtransferase
VYITSRYWDSMSYKSRARLNSHLTIDDITGTSALTAENAMSLLESYDIIVDCTDNAPTRYLVSDMSVTLKDLLSAVGRSNMRASSLCTTWARMWPCY